MLGVVGDEQQEPCALEIGGVFNERYEIRRCIKAGGMGAVYEVLHLQTNRPRALKVMLPSVVSNEDLRGRFKLEATVISAVESDHIAEVLDAGVDDATGSPFILMELLKGEELGAMAARMGHLPPEDVALYLQHAAYGLEKTHEAGKAWSTQVTVAKDGDTKVVAVPQLEEETGPNPVAEPKPPTPTPEPVVPAPVPEPPPDEADGGVPAWAWVAGAVGVVAIGVAIVFAVDQASVSSEIDDRCGGEARNLCTPDYDFDAAHSREKRDFGLFLGLGAVGVVGIVVAIAGIAVGSGDPDDASAFTVTPIVSGDVAGVGVSGSF